MKMDVFRDAIIDAFEDLTKAFEEINRSLIENFGKEVCTIDYCVKTNPPKRYGQSLEHITDVSTHYHYLPVVRKHEPYQRRSY